MKRSNRQGLAIALAILLLVGGVLLSWLTHGRGVVRDDPKRNISVPKTLTVPLQVRAAYNAEKIFVNYRWPADRPGLFHDVLVYEGGRWVVKGRATPGSQPDGMHEDRVAMMLDDGGVPEFARYGGYITVGDGILTFTNEASEDAVKAHPYLGGKLKQEEVEQVAARHPQRHQRLGQPALRGSARGTTAGGLLPRPVALAQPPRQPDRDVGRPDGCRGAWRR